MREAFLNLSTELLTPRLRLRRLGEGDGIHVFALIERERERLRPGFPVSVDFVTSPERGELAARRKLTEWYLEQSYSFGLWSADRYIGYLALKSLDWSVPKADMGYYLASEMEGRGLMGEALSRALQFAFEELGLARVYLRIAPENLGSQKGAEKCGFVREGLLRGDYCNGQDMFYYGYTADQWKSR